LDGISKIGKQNIPRTKIQKPPKPPEISGPKEDPGEMVLEFICSKGDREYHSINDSFAGVRAHEEGHIAEYHEMAQKLGLKVVNPHISVFSKYFPEFGKTAATGGLATCQFTAIIDGQEVVIPVSKDGHITNSKIVEKLEQEKKRRMGLLPKKNDKKSGSFDRLEAGKTNKSKKIDNKKETPDSGKANKAKKRGNPEEYLFYDGN